MIVLYMYDVHSIKLVVLNVNFLNNISQIILTSRSNLLQTILMVVIQGILGKFSPVCVAFRGALDSNISVFTH